MRKKTGKLINCVNCNKFVYKALWKLKNNAKFCSKICKYKYQRISLRGKNNPKWKGEKIYRKDYILIYQPSHPFCNHLGYLYEHRLVMEKKIGRYLTSKEVVHHLDHNRLNNSPDNLYLFENSITHFNYHKFLRQCIKEII